MTVPYVIDHIPRSTPANRRPGGAMTATTITIHNTGNPASSARNERAWLTNPANTRTASYHIVVDERESIECIPLGEPAWHAGDGRGDGNMRSIGVEICESGDYAKTVDNAAELVARLLKERGWGVDRLRRHYDWSGKICPRLMYDGGTWAGWQAFKDAVAAKLNEEEAPEPMLDKGVAQTVINTWMKPSWHEADARGDRQQADYIHWLANELRKAAGIEAE